MRQEAGRFGGLSLMLLLLSVIGGAGAAGLLGEPPRAWGEGQPSDQAAGAWDALTMTGIPLGATAEEVTRVYADLRWKPSDVFNRKDGTKVMLFKKLPRNPLGLRVDEVTCDFSQDRLIETEVQVYFADAATFFPKDKVQSHWEDAKSKLEKALGEPVGSWAGQLPNANGDPVNVTRLTWFAGRTQVELLAQAIYGSGGSNMWVDVAFSELETGGRDPERHKWYALGKKRFAEQKYAEATTCFANAMEDGRADVGALMARAEAYMALGDYQAAGADLEAAEAGPVPADDIRCDILCRRAYCRLMLEDCVAAREDLDKVMELVGEAGLPQLAQDTRRMMELSCDQGGSQP